MNTRVDNSYVHKTNAMVRGSVDLPNIVDVMLICFMLSFCTDKPENVSLTMNISNKVCAGVVVRFTCTAEVANPAPHNYTLFENESAVVQHMESPGVWIRRLNTAGEVTYRCEARNSIGNDSSSNTTITVEGESRSKCFCDGFASLC